MMVTITDRMEQEREEELPLPLTLLLVSGHQHDLENKDLKHRFNIIDTPGP